MFEMARAAVHFQTLKSLIFKQETYDDEADLDEDRLRERDLDELEESDRDGDATRPLFDLFNDGDRWFLDTTEDREPDSDL